MGESGRAGEGRPSDFDLCPEGLLDVLCVRVSPCPDGEAAVLPQGRGHGSGVHVLGQLAFVSEGVHDRAISCQLRGRAGSGPAALHLVRLMSSPSPFSPVQVQRPLPLRGLLSGWCPG